MEKNNCLHSTIRPHALTLREHGSRGYCCLIPWIPCSVLLLTIKEIQQIKLTHVMLAMFVPVIEGIAYPLHNIISKFLIDFSCAFSHEISKSMNKPKARVKRMTVGCFAKDNVIRAKTEYLPESSYRKDADNTLTPISRNLWQIVSFSMENYICNSEEL